MDQEKICGNISDLILLLVFFLQLFLFISVIISLLLSNVVVVVVVASVHFSLVFIHFCFLSKAPFSFPFYDFLYFSFFFRSTIKKRTCRQTIDSVVSFVVRRWSLVVCLSVYFWRQRKEKRKARQLAIFNPFDTFSSWHRSTDIILIHLADNISLHHHRASRKIVVCYTWYEIVESEEAS